MVENDIEFPRSLQGKKQRITDQQKAVLEFIAGAEGGRVEHPKGRVSQVVAEQTGLALPTVSSVLKRLDDKGYVMRDTGAEAKRTYAVQLTTVGRRLLQAAWGGADEPTEDDEPESDDSSDDIVGDEAVIAALAAKVNAARQAEAELSSLSDNDLLCEIGDRLMHRDGDQRLVQIRMIVEKVERDEISNFQAVAEVKEALI